MLDNKTIKVILAFRLFINSKDMRRKALLVFLSLVFLVSLSFFWLSRALNKEAIRAYVNQQLVKLSEQPAEIKGNIRWRLFPQPAVNISKIVIGEISHPKPYALMIKNLQFKLQLSALFHGQLIFNDLSMDGVKFYLNGKETAAQKTKKPAIENPSMQHTQQHFSIQNLSITHGDFFIEEPNKIAFRDITIQAENINLDDELFPIKIKAKLLANFNNEQLILSALQFQGRTHLSAANMQHFNAFNLNGQLLLNNLKINAFQIDKLSANTHLNKGLLKLNPLSFNLYNATSVGHLYYNFATQKLEIKQTATDLNSEKLALDLFKSPLVSGKLDYSFAAQLKGKQQSAEGYINIKDGSINTIDLNQVMAIFSKTFSEILLNSSKNYSQELLGLNKNTPGKTLFKIINIPFTLAQKKLSSSALALRTDAMQIHGKGEINLNNNAINGRIEAQLAESSADLAKIENLLGGSLPFVISGNITQPLIVPDLALIGPALTRLLLTKTLKDSKDTIKKALTTLLPE